MITKEDVKKVIAKLQEGGYIGKDGHLENTPEFKELVELAEEHIPEPVKKPIPVKRKVVKK
jgi:hypothetical protein